MQEISDETDNNGGNLETQWDVNIITLKPVQATTKTASYLFLLKMRRSVLVGFGNSKSIE